MKKLRGLIAVIIVALIIATIAQTLSLNANGQDVKSSMSSALNIQSGSYQSTSDEITHIETYKRKHMSDEETAVAKNMIIRAAEPRFKKSMETK